MALLDTTVYIDLRGRRGGTRKTAADTVIHQLRASGEAFVTSRLNVAEMYIGVELGNDPAAEAKGIADFLSWTSVVEFDDLAARFYARIRAALQRRGHLVGELDMLIGSIALANSEPIVTRNASHFNKIPGLTVIGYGEP